MRFADRVRSLNEGSVLPLEGPSILVFDRRHPDDAPDLVFVERFPKQHREQLLGVQAVGCSASGSTVDLDARGVDDAVVDAVRTEEAVNPEAIAPRLLAARDASGAGALPRLLEGLEQPSGLSRPNRGPSWPAVERRRPDELPLPFPEFEGHEKAAPVCGRIVVAGRCGLGHGVLLPVVVLEGRQQRPA